MKYLGAIERRRRYLGPGAGRWLTPIEGTQDQPRQLLIHDRPSKDPFLRIVRDVGHEGVDCFCFSPDGRLLLAWTLTAQSRSATWSRSTDARRGRTRVSNRDLLTWRHGALGGR